MNRDAALSTFRLEAGVSLAQASPWHRRPVTLDSLALQVMTDLTQVKAATVRPDTSLAQAELTMIHQGVRMLFVVSDMPAVEGLVTVADLHGDRQMQLVHARGAKYEELTVADVMSSLSMLDAVDYGRLRAARVGNIIATLVRTGRDHLLAIQEATAQHPRRVRGVFSRSQIERQLGHAIDMAPVARSFSEIERALA
jgi:CBS domain-containing protein